MTSEQRIGRTIRVAIVEDLPEIREGLSYLIDSAKGFTCIGSYADAEGALVGLSKKQPDVVLMDIGLPGMSGIECIRKLKDQCPEAEIMMLTVFEDPERIFQSLKAGATGFLIKKTPPGRLLEAIRELHLGGSPISDQIARLIIQEFQKPNHELERLSAKEQEVLRNLADGHLYKEISQHLGISIETVRTHVRNIYKKLQVRSRAQAVRKVFGKAGHS